MVDIFGEYDNKHNFRYLSEGDYENPNDKSILFAARVFCLSALVFIIMEMTAY